MKHEKIDLAAVNAALRQERIAAPDRSLLGTLADNVGLITEAVVDSIRRAGDTSLESYWAHVRRLHQANCIHCG